MFKDERGIIKDLLVGKDFSITHITFEKGAVRGNHYHNETVQHDIILKGSFCCKNGKNTNFPIARDIVSIEPGTPHAYEALEKSEIISICFGKRIGKNYAKDTFKLNNPLL